MLKPEAAEALDGKRRCGAHAQRRERAGGCLQRGCVQGSQVAGREKRPLHMFGGFDPCRPKRLGRKVHEPLVEAVNRSSDVRLPEVRLVGVDSSRIHVSHLFTTTCESPVSVVVLGCLTSGVSDARQRLRSTPLLGRSSFGFLTRYLAPRSRTVGNSSNQEKSLPMTSSFIVS